MKQIITLSGDIGSGKSSVALELQKLTGFNIIGTGKIQRAIAERRGMTTLELNELSASDRSIDDEIDNFVIETGKTQDHLIIDSRLAWHFIPKAFKVYLAVDPLVGAKRVYEAGRSDEDNPTPHVTLDNNLKRQSFEDERFFELYGIRFRNYCNYDLVIDSSYSLPGNIAEKIYNCFQSRNAKKDFFGFWLDPRRLTPTQTLTTDTSKTAGITSDIKNPVSVVSKDNQMYVIGDHSQVLIALESLAGLIPARVTVDNSDHRANCSSVIPSSEEIASIKQTWDKIYKH